MLNRRIILKQCGFTQATLKESTIYRLSDYTPTTNMKRSARQCDELQRHRGATRLASCVDGGPHGRSGWPIKSGGPPSHSARQWHGRAPPPGAAQAGSGSLLFDGGGIKEYTRPRCRAAFARSGPTSSRSGAFGGCLGDAGPAKALIWLGSGPNGLNLG